MNMNLPTPVPHSHYETKTSFFVQTLVPFLFAGLGLILAGVMLERAEGYQFFVQLPDAVMMVPTLVGLKGNLEMTLSSRLSTLSNLGFMDTRSDKFKVALSNLALVQTQAIVVSSLSVVPVLLIGEQVLSFGDTVCLLLSAVATASLASFLLSVLMVVVVIAARAYKLNPDNMCTPVAASLGDVSTLFILISVGTIILELRHAHAFLLVFLLLFFYIFAFLCALVACRDQFTLEVLKNGWWPVLVAMAITTASGFVLKNSIKTFPAIAAFQPLINGIGGNLVAVQASRISTQLHRARKNREKEVKSIHVYINPLRAFFYSNEDATAARILLALSVPCNVLFIHVIFLFGCGFHNTLPFTISFLVACLIQITLLLYTCQILVRSMWVLRIDPDNSAIPFLTAMGDLLGSLLLIAVFTFQADYFGLPVRIGDFDLMHYYH